MTTLDNYIGRNVIAGVLMALVVITALFVLISFAGEFDDVGRARYDYWTALGYVLLRAPRRMYEAFPVITVLGVMLGLGTLAGRGELVAVRAAGVSTLRIVLSVLRAALLLMVAAFILGEVVAPPAEQYGQQMRLTALASRVGLNTRYGLWVRDGSNFVHVQQVTNDGRLVGVYVYTFDRSRRLATVTYAREARPVEDGWRLHQVRRSHIGREHVETERLAVLGPVPLLPADVIRTVSLSPDVLSVWRLRDYIDYLEQNGLDKRPYELAYWNKVMMPLAIAGMVLLAVPFVMGSVRHVPVGQRVFTGFMLGLGFFVVSRLLGQMVLVLEVPVLAPWLPLLGAVAPVLLVIGVGVVLLRLRL